MITNAERSVFHSGLQCRQLPSVKAGMLFRPADIRRHRVYMDILRSRRAQSVDAQGSLAK